VISHAAPAFWIDVSTLEAIVADHGKRTRAAEGFVGHRALECFRGITFVTP
jgi:hypothetical protein